jgi:hypothetical protein
MEPAGEHCYGVAGWCMVTSHWDIERRVVLYGMMTFTDTSVFVDAALPLSVEVRLIVSPEIFGFQHNGMYFIFSEAPSAGVEC